LTLQDFEERTKLSFPKEGSDSTPSHDFDNYVFYTYAGPAFENLRERFSIQKEHFLFSLCHEKSLAIVGTPGKSGSLFFFSLDMQYIIKTISKKESKTLRDMLPQYYNVLLFYFLIKSMSCLIQIL
jgi:1-phosphatidylinositol-4-phosphate 5-kinase